MKRFQEKKEFDVLVIGGGLAAMRAALAAAGTGARTGLMLKGVLGQSGSSAIAGGGLAAVMDVADVPEDSVEKHFKDTLASADYVSDSELVRQLVTHAAQAVRELEEMGAQFVRKNDGEIEVFLAPAHSYRRSVRVAGGGTARMIGPLTQYLRSQSIEVMERTSALEILLEGGRAAGVVAVHGAMLVLVRAKAIVLATGGAGRIYPLTSNMTESTGDGYAMALRSGVALTGMEFVQFTPTALSFPKALEGTSTGGVLLGLEGTRMWNAKRERFMERYDPVRKEASTRAILSRAIQTEVVEGRGSPHGGVFLDLTRNDADTLERLAAPFMKTLAPHGIDIRRQPIEIAPAVHYFMGGVEINPRTQTAVPGLYAAGEVAGGVQGSNRLSSNSLSDVNVFGKIAGFEAAVYAREQSRLCEWEQVERLAARRLERFHRENTGAPGARLGELHARLKQVMFAHAGLVRDAESMMRGIEAIAVLRVELDALAPVAARALGHFYEVRNMLDVAEVVTRSALHREESRGAHFRIDYPEKNDARWLVATRVFGSAGSLQLDERDLSANAALAAAAAR
ncbi:MAG: FAD-binding protein [Betaproteobacteria bacterium]|nr:FAD-binding protein [Betaproteobacteria bacterium]